MPKDDAVALAWGGLQKSIAWQTLLATDPAKAQAIAIVNRDYRAGNKGIKCN